jgi:serine/threonine protein kinase
MNRKVIGEGTYGCVHKPSLHCLKDLNNSVFNYKNYVSKIMKTKDAEIELKEFVVIGSYDPTNEFHLGPPILCQPELNDKIIDKDISKCKYIKSADVKADPNDYKILLMKFGGPDLKNLCSSGLRKYLSTKSNSRLKTDRFWLEVHHLIKGLKFFKDNGIIHNDIKPQNILFDIKTGKLAFIDFGLMRSKEEIITTSKKSDNFLGIYHWSYPFECGIMNKNKYESYHKLSAARKNTYKSQLSEMIIHHNKQNTFSMPISNPNAFNILFTYINPDGLSPPDVTKYGYIEHFFDGINNLMSTNDYDTVLTRIVNSIDVYGLGFTLQYILNCFYRQNAIDLEFFTRLTTFFHKMYDFNSQTRELNIDNLINEYETILLETGILTRLKKSFENNILTNSKPIKTKMKKIRANAKSKSLSKELELFAKLDPSSMLSNSSIFKNMQKKGSHYISSSRSRSRSSRSRSHSHGSKKNSSPDTFDRLQIKSCPSDKELNLVTNRCVKKCKLGQTRNAKFRCVSAKTRKR